MAVLAWLFPANDIYARLFQPRITRAEAIELARALNQQYGVDTGGWAWAVTTETRGEQTSALTVYPESAVLQSLNPLSIRVLATAPSGESVLTIFGPSGRPTAFQRRSVNAPRGGAADGAAPADVLQRELVRYAGAHSAAFELTSSGVASQEGLRTAWEWRDPAKPGILARFELVTRNRAVMRATYSTETAFRLLVHSRRDQQIDSGALISGLIGIGALIGFLGIWNFFSRMTTRMDHVRFGLLASLLAAAPILGNWLSGNIANQAAFASLDIGTSATTIIVGSMTGSVLIIVGISLLLASGYALLPEGTKARWVALRLVSQHQVLAAPVGREITLGLLGGAAAGVLFYLPAAIPALAAGYVQIAVPSFLMNPAPSISPLSGLTAGMDLLALFAFFLPWLQARQWRAWVVNAVFGVAGLVIVTAIRQPYPRQIAASLIACGLVLAAISGLYRATGVLAVWFSTVGMLAVVQASTQLSAGTPGYVAEGGHTALLWLGVVLAGALVWRFGAKADEQAVMESMQPSGSSISRSDRDRLLAEFAVARRAQEGMLPVAPPAIPSYTLAASCEPAREVGGDLYDFLPFPGGEWGLCVADVSGKGVPAALYMTLTKGMLVSAASRPADLPLIASRMNRFLAEAGRRRTFVTMSLGVLDAPRGIFRHVRAGHNPPVLYTAHDRACRYLMPKGIGLGITAGAAFERNLEVEEIGLNPGDVLVLYSDGLTECMDTDRQLYGEDRLCDILRRNAHLNASGIQDAILTDARAFRGAADPHDDLTIVVLRAETRDSLR
jgi:hypothetical protein